MLRRGAGFLVCVVIGGLSQLTSGQVFAGLFWANGLTGRSSAAPTRHASKTKKRISMFESPLPLRIVTMAGTTLGRIELAKHMNGASVAHPQIAPLFLLFRN